MSATIGDISEYTKNALITDYKFSDIPSTFPFNFSNIYFVPGYKMSIRYKYDNYPKIANMISNIFDIYKDYRGCILVSSYQMAKDIRDLLPKDKQSRLLLYETSREKSDRLAEFSHGSSKNKVLIGPSLFDGISLDDDLCRFLIIAKIPYPDLSNNFCNKKREKNPLWYSGQAALNIIQGVGRGVRSETDWCQTFILDDCFDMLMRVSNAMFSNDFKRRINVITEQSLVPPSK